MASLRPAKAGAMEVASRPRHLCSLFRIFDRTKKLRASTFLCITVAVCDG